MKVKLAPKIKGTFVSIGERNGDTLCAVPLFTTLPSELQLGTNPLPEKERDNPEALWLTSCSWVASREAGEFTILKLEDAIRKGKVKVLKRILFVQTAKNGHKNKFRGDIIVPKGFDPKANKQPRCVGVLNARGWPHGRIESTLVHEADKSIPPRNKAYVAKLVLK
jgi:hypothetical protein